MGVAGRGLSVECWLGEFYLPRCRWYSPGQQSAFLIIRDLSRLTHYSAMCSFSDRVLFRGGQSSVIAVMYSSSLGLLALGGIQVDLGLKGCLAVGGWLSFLKKCVIPRHLTREFISSHRIDMSGASGVGDSLESRLIMVRGRVLLDGLTT